MTIKVANKEAARLTRSLANIEGISLTEAIVMAMKEALQRRRSRESPSETAVRLRTGFGIGLTRQAQAPLSRGVYDELSGEN